MACPYPRSLPRFGQAQGTTPTVLTPGPYPRFGQAQGTAPTGLI